MKFWLDMGVDGFRMDTVPSMYEDQRYVQSQLLKKMLICHLYDKNSISLKPIDTWTNQWIQTDLQRQYRLTTTTGFTSIHTINLRH